MEERYSLNGLYRFSTDPDNTGLEQQWMVQENQPYLDQKTRISVPSCWNRQTSKEYMNYKGIAWYWRVFRIPIHFNNRTVFLRFNGVVHNALIFIDAQEIGEFKGGFMPFEINISKFCDNKDHFLAIRIDGSDKNNRYPPETIMTPYYGIIGNIELRAVEKLIIEDWFYTIKLIYKEDKVTVNYAEIEYSIYLKNNSDKDFKGSIGISLSKDFVQRANVVKEVEVLKLNSRLMKILVHLEQPQLWTPEEPNVLSSTIQVRNVGLPIAEISEIIGIREIKIENQKLTLNNKPYEIRGYDMEIDQPSFGYTLPESMIIDKMQRLKEININTIRPAQGFFSPFIIEMASRLGFLVIQDLPLTELKLDERDNFYKILIENIKFQPSLICYSILQRIDQTNPQISKLVMNLRQLISGKHDSTRLFINTGFLNAKSWIRNEISGFKDIMHCD